MQCNVWNFAQQMLQYCEKVFTQPVPKIIFPVRLNSILNCTQANLLFIRYSYPNHLSMCQTWVRRMKFHFCRPSNETACLDDCMETVKPCATCGGYIYKCSHGGLCAKFDPQCMDCILEAAEKCTGCGKDLYKCIKTCEN